MVYPACEFSCSLPLFHESLSSKVFSHSSLIDDPPPPNPAPLRPRIALSDTPSRELCTKTPYLGTRISGNPQLSSIYANRSVFRGAGCTILDNNQWRNSGKSRVQHVRSKGRAVFRMSDTTIRKYLAGEDAVFDLSQDLTPANPPPRPKPHPLQLSALVTLLNMTSPFPAGELPFIPARFPCFRELFPLQFGG
jgi:hypothetical protein